MMLRTSLLILELLLSESGEVYTEISDSPPGSAISAWPSIATRDPMNPKTLNPKPIFHPITPWNIVQTLVPQPNTPKQRYPACIRKKSCLPKNNTLPAQKFALPAVPDAPVCGGGPGGAQDDGGRVCADGRRRADRPHAHAHPHRLGRPGMYFVILVDVIIIIIRYSNILLFVHTRIVILYVFSTLYYHFAGL